MKCLFPFCLVEVEHPRKRCEEHARQHHIQETMRQRRVLHDEMVWSERLCPKCGDTFKPTQSVGQPPKYCSGCRGYQPKPIPPCSRCSVEMTERRKYCNTCRPIVINEQRLRYRPAPKPDVICSRCGQVSRSRKEICTPCSKAARRRESARLRNFRERLFTTLVHTPEDADFILNLLESPCIYCGSTDDITIEHKVPLIMGGEHTKANLAPACRSCNSRKQDKVSI
jgi:5-methylcytosine-specific restriction endonuclease McrA